MGMFDTIIFDRPKWGPHSAHRPYCHAAASDANVNHEQLTTPDWNHTISSCVISPIPQGKELENLMKRRFNLTVVAAGALTLVLLAAAGMRARPASRCPGCRPGRCAGLRIQ